MRDIEERWGNAVFAGKTSFGVAVAPIIVYFKYILGLRPIRPGFAEYSCIPRQYGCHKAEGTVVTPAGQFKISASQEKYDYRLQNAGVDGTFYVNKLKTGLQ